MHRLVEAITDFCVAKAKARVERLCTAIVEGHGERNAARARADCTLLHPRDQLPANALAPPRGRQQNVDDAPLGTASIEVQSSDRRVVAAHDPEIGARIVPDEMPMLEAELIVDEGMPFRLRPGGEQ